MNTVSNSLYNGGITAPFTKSGLLFLDKSKAAEQDDVIYYEKEIILNKLSQFCYINIPKKYSHSFPLEIGKICDYYLTSPMGRIALKKRFGKIEMEYDGWIDFLGDIRKNHYDISITAVFDDNQDHQTGLYGCIFRLKSLGDVIAFRGSEMLGNSYHKNDYETDFALSYMLETPQQLRAIEFIKEYEHSLKGDVYLTGHSLGGNLAIYAMLGAKGIQDKVAGCYAFNAPGFNDNFLVTYASRIQAVSGKIFNYQNKYDMVSSIFNTIGDPIIIDSNYIPSEQKNYSLGNMLYPHSNYCFKIKDGKMVRSKRKKKVMFCNDVFKMTKRFLQFPICARRDICGIILDILYSGDGELPVSKIIDAIIIYCKAKKKDICTEIDDDLLSVLESAKTICVNCTANQALSLFREEMDLPKERSALAPRTELSIVNALQLLLFNKSK